MISDKALEALKPPTYEKLNELRIAAEQENFKLKQELIKAKHENSLLNERLEKEAKALSNKVHQQYAREKAIKKKAEDALYRIEFQLGNIDCHDIVGSKKDKIKFKKLKLRIDFLILYIRFNETIWYFIHVVIPFSHALLS